MVIAGYGGTILVLKALATVVIFFLQRNTVAGRLGLFRFSTMAASIVFFL